MEHCFGLLRKEKNRADLTACTENIMLARETHIPATIAELYDPERLEKLFDLYTTVTGSEEISLKKRLQATQIRGR